MMPSCVAIIFFAAGDVAENFPVFSVRFSQYVAQYVVILLVIEPDERNNFMLYGFVEVGDQFVVENCQLIFGMEDGDNLWAYRIGYDQGGVCSGPEDQNQVVVVKVHPLFFLSPELLLKELYNVGQDGFLVEAVSCLLVCNDVPPVIDNVLFDVARKVFTEWLSGVFLHCSGRCIVFNDAQS
jgi:hypothetical protein